MKKILASVLTAAMLVSMGTAAFAISLTENDPKLETNVVLGHDAEDNEDYLSVYITDTPATAYQVVLYSGTEELTYVTPLGYPEAGALNDADVWCKFVIGGGVSNNWQQNYWQPVDSKVPTKVAVYTVSSVNDELVRATTPEAELTFDTEDFTSEAWGNLASTADDTGDDATYDPNYPGQETGTADFNKAYDILTGTAPADTFSFTFEFQKYVDGDNNVYFKSDAAATEHEVTDYEILDSDFLMKVPALNADSPDTVNKATVDFAETSEDTSENVVVALEAKDFPEIGVYTYKVTEDQTSADGNKTAGVIYNTNPIYLVVTVLRQDDNTGVEDTDNANFIAVFHYNTVDGTKTGEIVNKYQSGSLEITKKIVGNIADMDKEFTFTVKFEAKDGYELSSTIANDGQREYTVDANDPYTYTFTLGNGDTATFSNIPVDAKYTVYENMENYNQETVTGENVTDNATNGKTVTGTISTNAEVDKASFTNQLGEEIDTGISVDSIPYIAMLGVVALGGTGLVISKKRRSED